MSVSSARRLLPCAVLMSSLLSICVTTHAQTAPTTTSPATEILLPDPKASPESLTMAPNGILLIGSARSPFVYKAHVGSTKVEKFIDVSSEGPGTFFFGMLADEANHMLWTCQLTPIPNQMPPRRKSSLRGFDLATGAARFRWDLPGDSTTCNDFAIGPDKALYISDTANGKIYKLPAGAATAELFIDNRALVGVDGITFLDGVLYVNSVVTNNLYRIPMDASGKVGRPEDIWMDQPIKGPDGMRAGHGKLFVAENGGGRISAITVNGDKASVTIIRDGLKTPTGVEPVGDTLWITERGANKVLAIPLQK